MSNVTESTSTEVAATPVAPVKLKVADIISMLDAGQDREEIRIHYGMKKAEMKRIFADPRLKGRKVKHTGAKDRFVLEEDDTEATISETAVETQPEAQEAPIAESAPLATEESNAGATEEGSIY